MSQSPRIKFFCRSFNLELYRLSRRLYEGAGYPCVRLTDQTADGYFFTMLDDQDCDIAINVDEDCFLTDIDHVLALAFRADAEGWVNIGCSDAGVGCPRIGNPVVTNPFFNIFNLRQLRTQWRGKATQSEVRHLSYAQQKEQILSSFDADKAYLRTDFMTSAYERSATEPYYNFFFWMQLAFPGRTLYLPSHRNSDGFTTELLTSDGRVFARHTWFARFFHPSWLTRLFEHSTNNNHSARIDAIIDSSYAMRGMERPRFGFSDSCAFALNGIARWSIKIPQRIANWPHKLMKKTHSNPLPN